MQISANELSLICSIINHVILFGASGGILISAHLMVITVHKPQNIKSCFHH